MGVVGGVRLTSGIYSGSQSIKRLVCEADIITYVWLMIDVCALRAWSLLEWRVSPGWCQTTTFTRRLSPETLAGQTSSLRLCFSSVLAERNNADEILCIHRRGVKFWAFKSPTNEGLKRPLPGLHPPPLPTLRPGSTGRGNQLPAPSDPSKTQLDNNHRGHFRTKATSRLRGRLFQE